MNIKSLIPIQVKQYLKSFIQPNNINGDVNSNKPKVYIGLAADYGNLGDVAISYAQYEFLKSTLPGYEIIDVPISRTISNIRAVKKIIRKDDIITLVGGGNLTNHYQDIENLRQRWVASFPKNKIISFPQTIDFSDDFSGSKAREKAFSVYGNHSKLTFFAREDVSFERLSKLASNKVLFCPDIVLSLNMNASNVKRKGILACIRSDNESNLSSVEKDEFIFKLRSSYGDNITFGDTHIERANMTWDERKLELERIWQQFREAEVIITDRLHGMIFSAITGTPCVVISNSNHKIKQTYVNWLSNLKYIQLLEKDNISRVNQIVDDFLVNKATHYPPDLLPKYQPLIDELLN